MPGEAPAITAEAVAALIQALREAATVLPEGLTAEQAATFCGIGRSAFYDLDRKGMCPAAVQLGSGPRRWLRTELMQWLRAGCPSRRNWLAMRELVLRRAG